MTCRPDTKRFNSQTLAVTPHRVLTHPRLAELCVRCGESAKRLTSTTISTYHSVFGLGTDFCWTRTKFLETISSLSAQTLKFPGNFREICYHR